MITSDEISSILSRTFNAFDLGISEDLYVFKSDDFFALCKEIIGKISELSREDSQKDSDQEKRLDDFEQHIANLQDRVWNLEKKVGRSR